MMIKIIAISSSKKSQTEPGIITQLFLNGLESFHLRKDRFSTKEIEEYIKEIPTAFHKRIMLHTHHNLAIKHKLGGIHLRKIHRKNKFKTSFRLRWYKMLGAELKVSASFHNLEDLYDNTKKYDYVFLSPIFDSISKSGYLSKFKDHNLKIALSSVNQNVIALGGVDIDKIEPVKDMGFHGFALVGALWQSSDPLKTFIDIKNLCEKNNLIVQNV